MTRVKKRKLNHSVISLPPAISEHKSEKPIAKLWAKSTIILRGVTLPIIVVRAYHYRNASVTILGGHEPRLANVFRQWVLTASIPLLNQHIQFLVSRHSEDCKEFVAVRRPCTDDDVHANQNGDECQANGDSIGQRESSPAVVADVVECGDGHRGRIALRLEEFWCSEHCNGHVLNKLLNH
jgi:hypothetical protein